MLTLPSQPRPLVENTTDKCHPNACEIIHLLAKVNANAIASRILTHYVFGTQNILAPKYIPMHFRMTSLTMGQQYWGDRFVPSGTKPYLDYCLPRPTTSRGTTARILGLYSLSDKMFYRKISWSLEAARFGFRLFQPLWNLTGTSAAALPSCLSNCRAIRSL